jgi:hypothetical protein
MRKVPVTAIVTLLLGVAGCGAPAGDGVATSAEQHLDGCPYGVKGWDCRTPGVACQRSCYTADESSRMYVAFTVGASSFDSRQVPYEPAVGLDNVLLYGCTLWSLPDAPQQGLDIDYKRILQGPGADRRSQYEDYVDVAIGNFHGPGSYQASPTWIASGVAQDAGRIFARKDGCGVEVDADAEGGITGTIACQPLVAPDGSTMALKGEFACPGTTLSPLLARLPP